MYPITERSTEITTPGLTVLMTLQRYSERHIQPKIALWKGRN